MPLWVAMLVSEDVRGWKGGDSEDGKPRLYAATRRQVHQRRRVPRTDEAGPRRRGGARRLPARRGGQAIVEEHGLERLRPAARRGREQIACQLVLGGP